MSLPTTLCQQPLWRWLTWSDLDHPEIRSTFASVRASLLQQLLVLALTIYLAWHFGAPLVDLRLEHSATDLAHRWALFPLVLAVLLGSWITQSRFPRLAAWMFVLSGAAVIEIAQALTPASWLPLIGALLCFAAVVLLHPLAALCCAGLQGAMFLLLDNAGVISSASATAGPFLLVALPVAVILGAGFGHVLVTAVEWSVASLEKASRSAADALQHRGELVRTLQQLDDAYYRLRQANAALEVAWRAADAAERSKSEFVTNISHELRTPLNLIAGFSEMMVVSPESYRIPLPPEYRGDAHAIYRSAQHLLTLTEDVLDLARIGIGRLALAKEPLNLSDVIEEAAAVVREYLTAKGLALHIEIAPALQELYFDRLRIRQVLLNFLTNAARFTEHGGITIRANTDPRGVLVEVIDTGPGIPPQDLSRIFDEYERGEQNTPGARRHRGYGLGLAISKRLIELHGGQIGASTPGTGTTFWFTLPSTNVTSHASEQLRPTDLSWLARSGERVLVLSEADASTADLLQRHLRGFRVVPTSSWNDACDRAAALHAAAILADSARELPSQPPSGQVIVALPLPQRERHATEMGVSSYLTKPVRRADLLQELRRIPGPLKRVLVIDDDTQFVRLIRRYLQAPGAGVDSVAVVAAYTAASALEIARQPFDAIILDLLLPDSTGRELLTSLRTLAVHRTTPVIIISAHEGTQEDGPLGTQLTVTKGDGFRFEELLCILEAVLGTLDPPVHHPEPDLNGAAGSLEHGTASS
ncbi:MAG: ATP-binding protein [Chloroflexi bacterium]|nr:ATP-binding protein [Chloroflexota bacterium]